MREENFNAYRVMKFAGMPAVESILTPSGGFRGGVGELTMVAAQAVLNAAFAATGKRVRNSPLKNTDLKQAAERPPRRPPSGLEPSATTCSAQYMDAHHDMRLRLAP